MSSYSGSIRGGCEKLEDIIERASDSDESKSEFSSSDEESVVDDRPYEERAPWEAEQEEEARERKERKLQDEERWYDGRPTRPAASKTERLDYGPRVPVGDPPKPSNYFVEALRVAAEEYKNRLQLVSERQFSPFAWTPILPVDPDIVEEEPAATAAEEFSDDDESYEYREKPVLTPRQAASLLYKPLGPWAKFSNMPIENSKVIYHLSAGAMCEATIRQGTLGGRAITYISRTWPLDQEWRGFFSELTLYQHPDYLAPLQGEVVPRIIGVYLLPNKISIAMELPHSNFWVEASSDMPDLLKRRCIAAFDKIHARGVLHNDIELRHMLIDADGRVTIIDFQESRALKPIPQVDLKDCNEADLSIERRQVLYKLNYEGARVIEEERRARVYKRLERNENRRRRREQASGFWSRREVVSDDELDDPEDIANPIVEPQIWMDLWVGNERWTPTCFVVPGHEPDVVNDMLVDYAKAILNTLKREKEVRQHAEAAEKRVKCLGKRTRDGISASASSSSAGSIDEDVESFRAEKRRAIDAIVYSDLLAEDGTLTADLTSLLNPVDVISSLPLSDAEKAFAISLLDGAPVEGNEEIHIPYEGYEGLDGSTEYTLTNSYPSKLVAQMRKDMIRQDNITRCEAEGLQRRIDPGNSLTGKRKSLHVSLGGLKRAREDAEEPGKVRGQSLKKKRRYFKKRGLPLDKLGGEDGRDEVEDDGSDEDKENDEPSGPKILTSEELKVEQEAAVAEGSRSSSPSSKGKSPMKGILRRGLSLEERIRLAAHEEVMRRLYPPVDEDDEGVRYKFGRNASSSFRASTTLSPAPRPQFRPLSAATTTATSHINASASSCLTPAPHPPVPRPKTPSQHPEALTSSSSCSPVSSSSSKLSIPSSKSSVPSASGFTTDPWRLKVDATWNPVLSPQTAPGVAASPKSKSKGTLPPRALSAFAAARYDCDDDDDDEGYDDSDEEDGEEGRTRFIQFGSGAERPRRGPSMPTISEVSAHPSTSVTPSSLPTQYFDPVRGSTASRIATRDQNAQSTVLGAPDDRRFRVGVGAASPSPMEFGRSAASLTSSPSFSSTTLRRTNASESILVGAAGPNAGTTMGSGIMGTSCGAYSSSNRDSSATLFSMTFGSESSDNSSPSGVLPTTSGEQTRDTVSTSTGKRKRAAGTGADETSNVEDNDGDGSRAAAGAAGAKRRDLGKSSARDLGSSVPRGSGGGAGIDIAASAGDANEDLNRDSTGRRASAKKKKTTKSKRRRRTSDTAVGRDENTGSSSSSSTPSAVQEAIAGSDSDSEGGPGSFGEAFGGRALDPERELATTRGSSSTARSSSLFGILNLKRWL